MRAGKNFIAAIALMTASINAFAANWQGYYVGGEYGRTTNHSAWKYDNANYFNTLGPTLLGSNFNLNANGKTGGLYAGYLFQLSSFIVGVEASLLKTNLNSTSASPFFPATDSETMSINRVSILKGRLGYAFQEFLISLNGGWSTANTDLNINSSGPNVSAHASQWVKGWIVGPAVEYRITNSFSLGLAYDYMQMKLKNKGMSCTGCGSGTGFGAPVVNGTLTTKTTSLRLSYFIG